MRIAVKRLIVLLFVLAGSVTLCRTALAQAANDEAEVVTAPVELDGVTLFFVRGVTSFPAAVRAGTIHDRLVAVAADRSIPVESLRVEQRQGAQVIVGGDRPIVAVVEGDAALENVSAAELARAHLFRIQDAIQQYRQARTVPALRGAALSTLTATALFLAAVFVVIWIWRRLDRMLYTRLEARIHTVGIQSFEVVRGERLMAMVRSGIAGVRSIVLLAVSLVYLGYVLALWPWTRGFSRDLKGFVLGPLEVLANGVVTHIPSLVFLVVLYFVVRLLLRLIRLFFEAVERGAVTLSGFDPEWAAPTYKIVRVAVVAFGLIVAYPYIPGSESAAFKGVSLFIGVVFSLGSSTAVSNIVAGYMMTYRRAFKVGDRVKIGDTVGDVIQMRLQVTHLRSLKNEEVVIPNSQILGAEVLNYSSIGRAEGVILHTEVGIGYETPWRQVEAMLLAAAQRTPGLAAAPPPFILLKKLGDFAVTYELNAYCTDVKRMTQLYTAMHRNVLDVFNEFGVQIMTPAYEGDPEKPKVVPPAEWYAEPASKSEDAPKASTEGVVATNR